MGDSFLSKSMLFEVVDAATEQILESFTLVIPPQSYSIKEKQRVNITKTFGNAFVDDYGPDNLEITVKGMSGTAHVFPTFQTTGMSAGQNTFSVADRDLQFGAGNATQGYRGREAFYYFRDRIIRYKDAADFDKKELRVYDLADQQAYKCVLLEFSLDRSADLPLRYPYTISLFVYARMGTKDVSSAKSIDIAKNPTSVLDNLLVAMDSFDKKFPIFKAIQKIKNQVAKVVNQTKLLRSKFNNWLSKGRSILESPLVLVKQVIEGLVNLTGLVYDAYNQGKILIDDYVNATENINNQIREALAMYGFSIQEGTRQSKNSIIENYNGMDYVTDPLAPEPRALSRSFAFSGYNVYTVRGGDTLQSIAQSLLGDENLWPHIASANPSIGSNNDLSIGSEIYIPVASSAVLETKDSFIVTEDTQRNPYGADIKLDSDGNMVLSESNDVSLINGVPNVLQSVDVRLKTQAGSLLKQTAFGLIGGAGMAGTPSAISYVQMNLKNSLIQDPRIVDVTNINVGFERDTMKITANIKLVGMDDSIPVSMVF
jgi:hypothetical protein